MIINSLLDTDFYKLTMQQAVLHRHPGTRVTLEFRCRNDADTREATRHLIPRFKEEIKHLCSLRFTEDELRYLAKIRFIKNDYIEFLRIFQFNENFLHGPWEDSDELCFRITGPWLHVILFETPLLAIISELWSERHIVDSQFMIDVDHETDRHLEAIVSKTKAARHHYANRRFPFRLADFGTRRRFSHALQNRLIEGMVENGLWDPDGKGILFGTSNPYFAMKHNIRVFGTMAHEWLSAGQAMSNVQLRYSQRHMLEEWIHEYRGDLGIALTDIIGMDAFESDFDLYLAKLYDGLRHDSGDPREWYEKFLRLYRNLRLDPSTKEAVFSDGLNLDSAIELYDYVEDRSPSLMAIGTALTNPVRTGGFQPLSIVIKMIECNDRPVAKLSDTPGKEICYDADFLHYLKTVFDRL